MVFDSPLLLVFVAGRVASLSGNAVDGGWEHSDGTLVNFPFETSLIGYFSVKLYFERKADEIHVSDWLGNIVGNDHVVCLLYFKTEVRFVWI